MNSRAKIGANIRSNILRVLEGSHVPISTRDIGLKIGRAWHSIQGHCLRLQVEGKVIGFKTGNMNLWMIKREQR